MNVFIATPLEAELVDQIRAAVRMATVVWEPDLLPPPRYVGDHRGIDDFKRDAVGEARWAAGLAEADVVLGIPGESPEGLRDAIARAPKLRWLQCMYAGAGEQVRRAALKPEELARVRFTTSAGVHATPLAEFVMMGVLALVKDLRRFERMRVERSWETLIPDEIAGRTMAILGMGSIGLAIARAARGFEMRVIGITRDGRAMPEIDEALPTARLGEAAARADVLAITLPGTEQTRHLVDRSVIAALPKRAIVANVGRGTVIDQAALIEALQTKSIAGAVLDVFDPEPLPRDNSLWTLDNVVFAPHTAARSSLESARIIDLFCDNLRRYAVGEALRNVVNTEEFY